MQRPSFQIKEEGWIFAEILGNIEKLEFHGLFKKNQCRRVRFTFLRKPR